MPAPTTTTFAARTTDALETPQRVNTVFDGVYYVAGEVPAADRTSVWHVIEPGSPFGLAELEVTAADESARALTPRLGVSSSPEDGALLDKARSCVREAAD